MSYYVDPSFFMLCAPIVAVAVVAGVLERPLRHVGLVASVAMLGLMFCRSLPQLVYVVAYLAVSVLLYVGVRTLFETRHPKAVLLYRVALAVQILPLVAYKVGVAFNPDFLGFLGISYITFKTVQVLIETRDGLIADMTCMEYLSFLCFFPTFTSGPILRSRAFVNDLRTPLARDAYLERLYRGVGWFLVGALYKYVCSALMQWALWMVPNVVANDVVVWLATVVCSGIDLFFDFAGYSNMAMGLGLVLGIEVPRNFRSPFLAIDIKDFWNRWHITLSEWLRDFVFTRFSRVALSRKLFESRITTACVGFVLNMALMGVWHGLTPDYVAYGLYHGVMLALCHLIQKKWGFYKKHRRDRWFRVISWALTMVVVFFGFALFGGYVLSPLLGMR